MKGKLLRNKKTNRLYFATPALEKLAHMIPVSEDEVDFNPSTGWQYIGKAKTPKVETPEVVDDDDDIPDTKDEGAKIVIDKHPTSMTLAEVTDFIEQAKEAFPEFGIEIPEEPTRGPMVSLASSIIRQIKEHAEGNNE